MLPTPISLNRYAIRGNQITLYGIWSADCFINTIGISFPTNLIDDDAAIGEFLRQQAEKNKAKREKERAAAKQTTAVIT